MSKKLWVLLCALALVMPLAACQADDGGDAGEEVPTESPAESPAESPS